MSRPLIEFTIRSLDWKGVLTFPQIPQNSRGGLVLPLEGNCWIVSVGGRHADKPPGDREGFLAYVQGLRTPTIYNAIRRAEPLGEVARFGFPASVWRHFKRLDAFPRGLLPIGDALCRFNIAPDEAAQRLARSRSDGARAGRRSRTETLI